MVFCCLWGPVAGFESYDTNHTLEAVGVGLALAPSASSPRYCSSSLRRPTERERLFQSARTHVRLVWGASTFLCPFSCQISRRQKGHFERFSRQISRTAVGDPSYLQSDSRTSASKVTNASVHACISQQEKQPTPAGTARPRNNCSHVHLCRPLPRPPSETATYKTNVQ